MKEVTKKIAYIYMFYMLIKRRDEMISIAIG